MPGIKIWLQLLRAPFFTAALIPMLVGACLALTCQHPVTWNLLPLVLLCGVLVHAGTNVTNDYFDFKKGVDTPASFGSSHVLTNHLVKPTHALIFGVTLFILAFFLGLILVTLRGKIMFLIGITGIIAAYFYTGKPFALKYRGLGDILVFIMMGPLMVIGTYYALTGTYQNVVLISSLPIGFLVTAILTGNNIRDIQHDRNAHITTLEAKLGLAKARILYSGLIFSAYATIIIMAATKLHSWLILVTFASLPMAFKKTALFRKNTKESLHSITSIDAQTAQLHLMFGSLFIAALTLEAWLKTIPR